MLSTEIIASIEQDLAEIEQETVEVIGSSFCSGGSINDAYELKTSLGSYFVKINQKDRYPEMFETELKGMQTLRDKCSLEIPEVIGTGTSEDLSYIVMEFLDSGRLRPEYWEDFGVRLARLHQNSSDQFGLSYDNYIGSLVQNNTRADHWSTFFIEHRLEPLIKLAFDSGRLSNDVADQFSNLYREIAGIFPEEHPALIHGDLWSGNFMVGPTGVASIFDPAIYYGHREMDIAMTKMFGGFEPGFYRGYNETYPLVNGWESRVDIANLYPLLVHTVLFDGGYADQIKQVLKRF